MSDRILPGSAGRTDYLDGLLKRDLRAECDVLDTEIATLGLMLDDADGVSPAGPDPFGGLLPMSLHVSGTEWNGNLVRLIRCAPGGELAESWMIQRGAKVQTRHGQLITARPYRQIPDSLKGKVRFSLAEARAVVGK